jgi:radical SAM protein (TIGR04043 family)
LLDDAASEHPETWAREPTRTTALSSLLDDLQVMGMQLIDGSEGVSRNGGAGPSDHKAVRIGGHVVMVPVFTRQSRESPFVARQRTFDGRWGLVRDGVWVCEIEYVTQPSFYRKSTADGVPYWKIATLHGRDVLATTVLQNCIRYANAATSCQFCAIGLSLQARTTIPRKTPQQLAEVAKAAVELDGVTHMVLTTGTPPGADRGAAILTESASAIKAAVALPLQGQCEPPDDDAWFVRLAEAGIDTLGMHLEAVSDAVRQRVMPGKAGVPVSRYLSAFRAAVRVFGRGQVTTYILAGLGDTVSEILEMSAKVAALGVYPFVVPFVPLGGTALANHPAPKTEFMRELLDRVAVIIAEAGLHSQGSKAGCGRCGACSTLRTREERAHV